MSMNKLKLMTVVGTRPEIIKMSRIIKKSDEYFDHVLVHTGQNYDHELNHIFLMNWDCAGRTIILVWREMILGRPWAMLFQKHIN